MNETVLRSMMKERKLKIRHLSERLDKNPGQVSNMINGKRRIDARSLILFMREFQVDDPETIYDLDTERAKHL